MKRKRELTTLVVLASCLLGASGSALSQPPLGRIQKASMEVVSDRTAYPFGAEIRLAARVLVEPGWHVQSHQPSMDTLIPTELRIALPEGFELRDIRYPPDQMWEAGFAGGELLAVYEGEFVIVATLAAPASGGGAPPSGAEVEHDLAVTLAYQACDDRVCLPPTETTSHVRLVVGRAGEPQHESLFAGDSSPVGAAAAKRVSGRGFGTIVLFALLGGLILNAMPCVLPILSLKVFGLIREAGSSRGAVTLGALATSAGILLSFWALAGAAIAARAAGQAVGWGIQFQNPGFVAFLAVVLVFFALNMWGLFEIPLPGGLARLAGDGKRSGVLGHLATGLFATLMATPCSAPFLGTAVGFALSQPAAHTAGIFTAIGLGMASPYLLVAATPRALAWLPKPGPWMETLKHVMGFLLAGAVVWLLYVLGAQISAEALAFFEGSLLLLGLCAWLRGRYHDRALGAAAGVAVAAMAIFAIALAARAQPADRTSTAGSAPIDWRAFNEGEAEAIAAGGGLVFVDVTADWCATCKVNERLVLHTPEVVELFERYDVVAMKADWTNRNDTIAEYLARFGRYAIPFYALYRPGREPLVFGELLTKEAVRRALEESWTPDLPALDAAPTSLAPLLELPP